jgi:methionine synthase I (cobalamin-dependent)
MFLDGAMGTMVQRLKLQESDFRGTFIFFFRQKLFYSNYYINRSRIFNLAKGFKGQ